MAVSKVITTDINGASSVTVGDLDGDGDLDVLSASSFDDPEIAWYENTDGEGNFGPVQVISTDDRSLRSVTWMETVTWMSSPIRVGTRIWTVQATLDRRM